MEKIELETILDPCNDRVNNNCPKPPRFPMSVEQLFGSKNQPNHVLLRKHLLVEGKLSKDLVL